MEDKECLRMFIHLQQYVPHLEKLVAQLKDPKKENRELQLHKLEGLHSMITDKKKKLKLDTLKKCEDVILKILQKVNPNIVKQLKPFIPASEEMVIDKIDIKEEKNIINDSKFIDSIKFEVARARLNTISTPASPPMEKRPLLHSPIVIPTEKIKSPPDIFTFNNWVIPPTRTEASFNPVNPHVYKTEKPDIYNRAAVTLMSSPKGLIFDRLGNKVDMSIPPLSEEDLQQLTTPIREVYYEDQNLEDLEDLREKIQKKIQKAEIKMNLPDLRTKLSNKEKDKSPSIPKDKVHEFSTNNETEVIKVYRTSEKLPKKVETKASEEKKKEEKQQSSKPRSPRVEKVIVDPSSQFGSLLSSIDEQILGDKKKEVRRDSSVKSDKGKVEKKDSANKESHSHEKKRDEKKKDRSDKEKKSEDDAKRRERHKSKGKDSDKSSSKDRENDKRSNAKEIDKQKSNNSDKYKEASSKLTSSDKLLHLKSTDSLSDKKKDDRDKKLEEESKRKEETSSDKFSEGFNARPSGFEIKQPQTFKRLADKYNPRPRKSSIEEIHRSPIPGDPRSPVNIFADPRSTVHTSNDPRSIGLVKDPRSAVNHSPMMVDPRHANHLMGDPRSAATTRVIGHSSTDPRIIGQSGDSRAIGQSVSDPRIIGQPVADPRSMGHLLADTRAIGHPGVDPRSIGHSLNDPRNLGHNNFSTNNFNSSNSFNFNKPQIPMDNSHLANQQHMIPNMDGNIHNRNQAHSMQMGFQSNNSMMRQNEFISPNNQFVSRQFMSNQNTINPQNAFSTVYYNKNNPNQVSNLNIPYQQPQSKAFHPYEPIESSNEYDLSKMSPADFYSPTGTQPVNQITSQPNYGNRVLLPTPRNDLLRQSREQAPRDPRKEETNKTAAVSKDPRIRMRELKEKSLLKPPKPKAAGGESTNKYDSLYSKLADRKIPDTFVSPLDSLYSGSDGTTSKSKKGYGIQNFKIPKKKSEFSEKTSMDNQLEQFKKSPTCDEKNDNKSISSDDEVCENSETKQLAEEKVTASNEPEVIEPSLNDPKLLSEFVAQMIQSTDKQKLLSTLLTSLEGSVSDKQKEAVKRIKQVIESDEIDDENVTCTNVCASSDDKKVSSTTEDGSKIEKDEDKGSKDMNNIDDDEEDSVADSDVEDNIKPKMITRGSINTRSSNKKFKKIKRRRVRKIIDLDSSFDDSVEPVTTTKLRSKRKTLKPVVEVKTRKCRTELDMLHEDIKEMFIRDGVLTANGKRMCTMLKGDKSDSEGIMIKEKDNTHAEEDDEVATDSPKRRARESNPKVVIEKADLSKLTSQSVDESDSESDDGRVPQRRTRSSFKSLLTKRKTRSSSRANYKEDTSEDEKLNTNKTLEDSQVSDEEELKISGDESKVSEDESKASEEETKALEEVDNVVTCQFRNKRQKRKRRGHSWASGIIKRPKKKATSRPTTPQLEDETAEIEQKSNKVEDKEEEEEKALKYMEPNKNYYFDPQVKPDCQLCSFKGRMIIQHYKAIHPQHEVLISRISPNNAELAIEESLSNKYNEFEIPVETLKPKFRRNKYTFQCRFCQVFLKNESTELFFDHLTSHTGEYRFLCDYCQFRTANNRSLRSHLHSSHHVTSEQTGSITASFPAPPDFNILFGYICTECNFIQLYRNNIEKHSTLAHKGDFSKIKKISMSMIQAKSSTIEETVEQTSSVSEENLTEEAVERQNSSQDENALVINENQTVKETGTNIENVKLDDSKEPQTEVDKEEIDKKKEEEEAINAFRIVEDQEEEIEKFEETKQEKMEEIHKTIVPKKRCASNLLNKLMNRLEDNQETTVSKTDDNTVIEKKPEIKPIESVENKTVASVFQPAELQSIPGTSNLDANLVISETHTESDTAKKILLDKRENKFESITNIIERLQGKLIAADSKQLPPLIPIEDFQDGLDFKPEEILAQVGPFVLGQRKNVVSFVCNIQSCLFSSRSPIDFKTHCTTLHETNIWDGMCMTCDKKTNYKDVLGAYTHLMEVHTPAEVLAKTKQIKEESETSKSYLRMRRLSGDKLSEKLENASSEDIIIKKEDPDTDVEIIDDAPTISVDDDESLNPFPFQITNVTSLADEEGEENNKSWETPDAPTPTTNNVSNLISSLAIISSAACFGTSSIATSSAPSITFPLQLQTTNGPSIGIMLPILSSIKGVASVSQKPALSTPKPTLPRQSLITSRKPIIKITSPQKTQSKKILLKDTPLQMDELLKPRKSKNAFIALLSEAKLKHLYKCPEHYCHFSTDIKKNFEMHLKSHMEYGSGMQIPCLYCNFKTSFNLIGIHYDIRHSKCLYCCAYCFYRAINQSYVEIHQQSEHVQKIKRVIIVSQNQDALMSQANITIPPIRNILKFYVCGQLGCEKQFLFEDDFKNHLATVHKGIPLLCFRCPNSPINEEAAVVHAQFHEVFYFHCRYCNFGANDIDDIYKHLSQIHFALPPNIIIRQFRDNGSGKKSSDFKSEDDKIFDHLLIQTNEDHRYMTQSARVYSGPATISNPQPTTIKFQQKVPNTSNETITLYKAPPSSSGIQIKFIKSPKLKENDVKKIGLNIDEVVQVSDDDDEPTIPAPPTTLPPPPSTPLPLPTVSLPPLTIPPPSPTLPPSPKPKSPIVLNSLIAQGQGIANITSVLNDDSYPTTVDPENFVNIEPEINSDDCTLIPAQSDKTVLADEDPLKLDCDTLLETSNENSQDKMDMESEETDVSLDESISNVTKKRGLTGMSLFRCANCKCGFKSSNGFKSHIAGCNINLETSKTLRPFKCYHCQKAFKTPNLLMDHLRLHSTPRFSCSLCDFKHQHQTYVRSHMKVRHKVTSISIKPIVANLTNYDEDCFILKPKFSGKNVSKDLVASNVLQDVTQNSEIKKTFSPEEVLLLPIRPIFNQNLSCSACGYASKVKANLVRHLRFHLDNKEVPVPAAAPVNPVPCLDKNEKMFDKMTNLAHSSFTDMGRMSGTSKNNQVSSIAKEEEANYPKFVPSAKRYVCGAHNCQYLNQEESILRNHVQTFHSDESSYKCLHCNESLVSDKEVINVESIIHHLKLHDLNLYKCKYCTYLHYLKSKIEIHLTDKHPTEKPHTIIIREMEQEPQELPQVEEVKEKKPWRCGICKYRCTTKSEIVSHAFNKHEVENQYNCALCNFKNNDKGTFESHFTEKHIGHAIEVNSTYYEAVDAPTAAKFSESEIFDTTPLWQRDRNKFKHIRGIPLDETSKVPKKSPFKATPVLDNLDKAIEAVANGTATLSKNSKTIPPGKKPKTLKEKRLKEDSARAELFEENDDVTVIEDVNEELPFSVSEKGFDDQITINYNGTESTKALTVKDIEEMDLDIIKFGEFSCSTGKFGKPVNKEYFCPICEVFKTKRVIEFTQHMYKDLDYDRFVCTRCGLSNTSNKVLERHSIKKHPMVDMSILPLAPDLRIEDFVSKVLAYQQRVMFGFSQPQASETKIQPATVSNELVNSEKCRYCDYTSKYGSDLKKHEIRHFATKPYKCGLCTFTGVTNSQIINHSKRVHPNRIPQVLSVPMPKDPVIIPISRKRRYNKQQPDSDASSDTFEYNESSDISTVDNSSDVVDESDDTVFVCYYCPKRGNTEAEIKEHWESIHKARLFVFRVKKVNRSSLTKASTPKSNPGLYQKCGYCDFKGSFEPMKKHIKDAHPDMTYSVFRFQCGLTECKEYLKNIEQAKAHCNYSHPNVAKVSYHSIPKPTGIISKIGCEFCILKFENQEDFMQHQKEMHSHLTPSSFLLPEVVQPKPSLSEIEGSRYKCPECHHSSHSYAAMRDHVRSHAKPFICKHCSQRFLYPSLVKSHNNKEHPNLEFKYKQDDEAMKRNDYLRSNILVLDKDGSYIRNKAFKSMKRSSVNIENDGDSNETPSPPAKKFKLTARKSTSKSHLVPVVEEGYSYYGCKPDEEDTDAIKCNLPFLDTMIKISLTELTFINIHPSVLVDDFRKTFKF